jgi:glucokinase
MKVLGIDLGATKLSLGVFSNDGKIVLKRSVALSGRKGEEVGQLICTEIRNILSTHNLESIGIGVPGISRQKTGTVWAPNISGWDDYPLLNEVKSIDKNIPVEIDSDRACYISGEMWQGNAQGCKDAIFMAVGTGIGVGVVINGTILRGAHYIAGAIGWLALTKPFLKKYISCGCFEYYASGDGIARLANELLLKDKKYTGELKNKVATELTAHDIFLSFKKNDKIAKAVINQCIEFWGMAVANLVSIFNPEKIILGGGVFGPAIEFIPAIRDEALKWAQPISIRQVKIEGSKLGADAGLYGAAFLAFNQITSKEFF